MDRLRVPELMDGFPQGLANPDGVNGQMDW